jgi:hypothetical protein
MKKILLIALLVVMAMSSFAATTSTQPWAKSFNKDGQLNLYASVGYWYGIDGSVGLELILGEFNLGGVPIDYGIMGRGVIEMWNYFGLSGLYWGAAPTFAVHLGLTGAPVEFYASAGIGFNGYSYSGVYNDLYPGFNIGFASFDGMMWHFSDKFAFLVEYGYVGLASVWGVGLEIGL